MNPSDKQLLEGNNITYLVPPGKVRCYVTGILRSDTPEENVRQRWARSLVEEYGYPVESLGIEVKINGISSYGLNSQDWVKA